MLRTGEGMGSVTSGHRAGRATVAPLLAVRKGKKAIEFYKGAFSATELYRTVSEDGAVVARLAIGESEFWVADESPNNLNFSPASLGGSTVRMVLIVDDPDAVFGRAVSAGCNALFPVVDQPYGWRIGRLIDPFGHHWEIGRPTISVEQELEVDPREHPELAHR
jgi:PhnB protein